MSVNEKPCVNCGAKDYHRQTTILALSTVEADGRVNPGRTFDVYALACRACGHMSLFSAQFATDKSLG